MKTAEIKKLLAALFKPDVESRLWWIDFLMARRESMSMCSRLPKDVQERVAKIDPFDPADWTRKSKVRIRANRNWRRVFVSHASPYTVQCSIITDSTDTRFLSIDVDVSDISGRVEDYKIEIESLNNA